MANGGAKAVGARGAAGWWFTLDQFLDRAERVLSSEIARRGDLATVGTTGKLIASLSEGVTTWRIEREYPPEAHIESAAARARPLFIKSDPVFHGHAMDALDGLTVGAPAEVKTLIEGLRSAWDVDKRGYRWSIGVAGPGVKDGPTGMRTDRQIARDFLYGELVHADVRARRRLRHISPDDQYLAAVVWVADVIRLTQATKQLIIDLRDGGYLSPRPR